LALQIGELDVALKIARDADNPQKWSQLADAASRKNNMTLVKECMQKANDYSGLLLLATSSGDGEMLEQLGEMGTKNGRHNISFLSAFMNSDVERCLDILIETNRLPEAAFFARTYCPSQMSRVVELWREELSKVNEKAGQSLADPAQYENLFPGLGEALQLEHLLRNAEKEKCPANIAAQLPLNIDRNPLEELYASNENQLQKSPVTKPLPSDPKKNDDFIGQSNSNLQSTTSSSTITTTNVLINKPSSTTTAAIVTTKSDDSADDDIDLEIEGITLDDNIDTSDVNTDDENLA